MSNIDDEEVREIIINALRFTKRLESYLAVFLREDDDRIVIRSISQDMRRKLSAPTNYTVIQILMRICDLAAEHASAFEEERSPMLPRPKKHLDYTITHMWEKWADTIMSTYETTPFVPPDCNPFADVHDSLTRLVQHVGYKHFNLELSDEALKS